VVPKKNRSLVKWVLVMLILGLVGIGVYILVSPPVGVTTTGAAGGGTTGGSVTGGSTTEESTVPVGLVVGITIGGVLVILAIVFGLLIYKRGFRKALETITSVFSFSSRSSESGSSSSMSVDDDSEDDSVVSTDKEAGKSEADERKEAKRVFDSIKGHLEASIGPIIEKQDELFKLAGIKEDEIKVLKEEPNLVDKIMTYHMYLSKMAYNIKKASGVDTDQLDKLIRKLYPGNKGLSERSILLNMDEEEKREHLYDFMVARREGIDMMFAFGDSYSTDQLNSVLDLAEPLSTPHPAPFNEMI